MLNTRKNMKFFKKFNQHSQYESYIISTGASLPNVSICELEEDVHMTPYLISFDCDDVRCIDQGNGTIIIVLPENATGRVVVTASGTNYYQNAVDAGGVSIAEFNFEGVLPSGEWDIYVKYLGNTIYAETPYCATQINIPTKPSPTITLVGGYAYVFVDGNTNTVTAQLPSNATGYLRFTIEGDSYNVALSNGQASFTVPNTISACCQTLYVNYSGDSNYNTAQTTANIDFRWETPLSIEASDTMVGNVADITVNCPEGLEGVIAITVDGVTYTGYQSYGKAEFFIDGLSAGTYLVTASYTGVSCGGYADFTTTAVFNVTKRQTSVTLDGGYNYIFVSGNTNTISATTAIDATGSLVFDLDGVGYLAGLSSGHATFTVPNNISAGCHTLYVSYSGDSKYESAQTTANIDFRQETAILINIEDINVGNPLFITVETPEDLVGNINLTLSNGQTYSESIIDGRALFQINGLSAGTYTCTYSYTASNCGGYTDFSDTTQFNVYGAP